MQSDLPKRNMLVQKVLETLILLRKRIFWSGDSRPNAQLRADLERLALAAPHVLSDIGFKRDGQACSNEKVVWRRGSDCVTILSSSQSISVKV